MVYDNRSTDSAHETFTVLKGRPETAIKFNGSAGKRHERYWKEEKASNTRPRVDAITARPFHSWIFGYIRGGWGLDAFTVPIDTRNIF